MSATLTSRQQSGHLKASARPRSSGDGSKGIWSSMLDNAATGRRLLEKNMLVLGGNIESQKNFLEAVSNAQSQRRRPAERGNRKKPPIANRFALGYTYQDILDTDHDDILARVSHHLLSDADPAFSPLLKPLFNQNTVSDFAAVILLDWGEPWNWLRQLRDWIRVLKSALGNADDATKDAMEENMKDWQQRRKGPRGETSATGGEWESSLSVPLGPGEWDEPLGIPLCVVCQNAEKIEVLEREHGWNHPEFDTVLVYLRTVLLKHGGSLIYTASSAPGSLHLLIRSALDIQSLLQQSSLKHNITERDKVLIPNNWDSWAKIRLQREGFDFETVSSGWSVDVQSTSESDNSRSSQSAVALFEEEVRNPSKAGPGAEHTEQQTPDGAQVKCPDNQEFFTRQLEALERYKQEDELAEKTREPKKSGANAVGNTKDGRTSAVGVAEHIGPVQFNVGGIQVDADEMLRSLKQRGAERSPESTAVQTTPESKANNEQLRSFFASLASRGGGSATSSPR